MNSNKTSSLIAWITGNTVKLEVNYLTNVALYINRLTTLKRFNEVSDNTQEALLSLKHSPCFEYITDKDINDICPNLNTYYNCLPICDTEFKRFVKYVVSSYYTPGYVFNQSLNCHIITKTSYYGWFLNGKYYSKFDIIRYLLSLKPEFNDDKLNKTITNFQSDYNLKYINLLLQDENNNMFSNELKELYESENVKKGVEDKDIIRFVFNNLEALAYDKLDGYILPCYYLSRYDKYWIIMYHLRKRFHIPEWFLYRLESKIKVKKPGRSNIMNCQVNELNIIKFYNKYLDLFPTTNFAINPRDSFIAKLYIEWITINKTLPPIFYESYGKHPDKNCMPDYECNDILVLKFGIEAKRYKVCGKAFGEDCDTCDKNNTETAYFNKLILLSWIENMGEFVPEYMCKHFKGENKNGRLFVEGRHYTPISSKQLPFEQLLIFYELINKNINLESNIRQLNMICDYILDEVYIDEDEYKLKIYLECLVKYTKFKIPEWFYIFEWSKEHMNVYRPESEYFNKCVRFVE